MEYEVYWLCNLLGLIVISIIILFHFIEADKKIKPVEGGQARKEEVKNK